MLCRCHFVRFGHEAHTKGPHSAYVQRKCHLRAGISEWFRFDEIAILCYCILKNWQCRNRYENTRTFFIGSRSIYPWVIKSLLLWWVSKEISYYDFITLHFWGHAFFEAQLMNSFLIVHHSLLLGILKKFLIVCVHNNEYHIYLRWSCGYWRLVSLCYSELCLARPGECIKYSPQQNQWKEL